jgi:hypothetical protein
MDYTAEVFRDGQLVATLSRADRPYGAADAGDWPGCVLVADGVEYPAPEPPTPDPVQQLQEQLDQLELLRAASIRQLRAHVAAALLANGWSQPDTMAAGRDFFASHAADIYGYVSGAAPAFAAAVSVDGREWLDLPAGGGLTIRELFAGALG